MKLNRNERGGMWALIGILAMGALFPLIFMYQPFGFMAVMGIGLLVLFA